MFLNPDPIKADTSGEKKRISWFAERLHTTSFTDAI